ncbi:SDR family oxidoreductase [Bacillus salacetis]|uniref:SDR family oxidoreductase n=1 Tax=Bacillus salacetis TaxID=2315464 RepID=A0A3A1RD22_9BACI|nr:SDR family oxidoreductase [Bacillus salacetis]RIW38855.1 SDR family oxidoreductase [Bacillus salacetis]
MNVLVIGANGKTGKHVITSLVNSSQHIAKAMIRRAEQIDAMEQLGAKPLVGDLEEDFSYLFDEVNAIIFAAGSGSSTGPDKTTAVDEEGAIKAIDYAKERGLDRFIMLSSMGADTPDLGPDGMKHYLEAKGKADQHLVESGLNYTIVRPGALVDGEKTGKITASLSIEDKSGSITREDVAEVLTACLTEPETYHKTFEILNGETAIEEALKNI